MAYITPTIKVNELLSEGNARLAVEFTGNAGEPPRTRLFTVSGASTMLQLREWAFAQLADLNLGRTVALAAGLQAGQVINAIAPPAPPAPTLEQIWVEKARRLGRAVPLGLTGQALTDLNALRADVVATYLPAYLGRL